MSLLLQVLPALAQQPAVLSFAPASQTVTAPTRQPNVSVVCILDSDGKKCSQKPEAGLQNEITLLVNGLKQWLDENKGKIDPDTLTLYLSEREIVGLHPTAIDREGGKIVFVLERTADSKNAWSTLLGPPRLYRNVRVSFGPPKGDPVPGAVGMRLLILLRLWSLIALALLALGLVTLFYVAIKKDVLRNPGKLQETNKGLKARKSYSLAKTQMLFWFAVVFFSFVVIWLVTWDRGISIPGTVLGLMGISAGTSAGGIYLGNKQREAKQKSAASSPLSAGSTTDQNTQDGPPVAADVGQNIQAQITSPAGQSLQLAAVGAAETMASPSLGFWKDLISENGEPSLQRLQIVFWTLLLGVIFLRAVWDTLAMPEYDATLLGLMTISSGTYLSSKLPSQTQ
jgi:hypothetical protein